ncbi:hypothetical protein LEP1GSC133_2432 [Leptospira borgpetersenii serovar Pomona str. 200901868]|uniref:Uncharacterized protein n=1 Tax=Leptospira borgpetersenii serovar Pomona str. 200901868 TaxID=1192866 RepID=M6WJP5_LEPBO|nr:hypothetical protein LEP1GSC133_2432 [Leptospira borgpetersenii serovar Pomona str. 200901868]
MEFIKKEIDNGKGFSKILISFLCIENLSLDLSQNLGIVRTPIRVHEQ